MPRFKSFFLTIILIVAVFCSIPSYAGFSGFSVEEEKELGQKFYILLHSQFEFVKDPVVTNYVQNVANQIKDVLPSQPFQIRINVIKNNKINAFAAPAGYVYLNTGLILKMQSESELAAVIAHEFAHVEERHLAKNIQRSKYLNIVTLAGVLAGALVGVGAQSAELGQGLAIGSMAGGQSAALKYNREQEEEADRAGLMYLIRANYNKTGMQRSLKRIKQESLLSGTNSPPPYMLTHPGINERINYLDNMVSQLDVSGKEKRHKNEDSLQRVQMLLKSKYSPLHLANSFYQENKDSMSCLSILGRAIVLQRMNRMERAEEFFQRALECTEDDFLCYREAGIFYFKSGEFQQAYNYLNKALKLNSEDKLALFYKAKVLAERDKIDAAENAFRSVLGSMPRDADVHYTLGRFLGQNGRKFEGFLHFAYAYMFLNKKENTEYYYQKARSLANTAKQKSKLEELKKAYKLRKKYW